MKSLSGYPACGSRTEPRNSWIRSRCTSLSTATFQWSISM